MKNLNKLNLSSKNLNNDNKKIVLGIIGTGAYANKFYYRTLIEIKQVSKQLSLKLDCLLL